MSAIDPNESGDGALDRWTLPVLLILVAGSGCSALIYEVVWFQLLQLVIGSTGVSLSVLLGTFMGGMCLGSVLLPRLVSPRRHPLLVYAALEFGIGVCGLLVQFGLPLVDRSYAALAGYGASGVLLRAAVCVLCLLTPAALMGGTLPAVARWLGTAQRGVSWIGLFYAVNIAGAVFGCLLAGFYLLRVHDMATAAYVAATINAVAALAAYVLAQRSRQRLPQAPPETATAGLLAREWDIYLVIALSGLCGLAAQVVWTRLLSLMLGASVYAFSIILAVFLLGLGIGSSAGSLLATSRRQSRLLLGVCQLLLAVAIAWAGYALTTTVPYWPIIPRVATSQWLVFQLDLIRCLWAVLPAAILWGASFPLALASVTAVGRDPGRLAGAIYAANTAGAIVGAIAGSLILIPQLGSKASHSWLIALSALSGLLLLVPIRGWVRAAYEWGTLQWVFRLGSVIMFVWLLVWLVFLSVPTVPGEVIAWGRYTPEIAGQFQVIYSGEGETTSVAVVERPGERSFHVCGKPEASNTLRDMRLQRMLGHLSAMVHPKPRSVLVIGCGMGVTAGTFVLHPEVERIVICEIERLVPKVAGTYFRAENNNVITDPRVQVVHDDGRHFLQSTQERFDIITTDPMHPWVRGSASLYTLEFFELCKRRLNPDGVVTQWVPLYETDSATVKSEIATFFAAFPGATIWGNTYAGDSVVLGRAEPVEFDANALREQFRRPDLAEVVKALAAVDLGTADDLLRTYAGSQSSLSHWLQGGEINRDRNLRLQYLAGMSSNVNRSAAIYGEIVKYRSYPESFGVTEAPPPKQAGPDSKEPKKTPSILER
jgi:spermidine synthase